MIVLGDLNDQIAEPMTIMFSLALHKPEEYYFADMPIALSPTYSTVSYPISLSHIDHILITNELFRILKMQEVTVELFWQRTDG